MAEAVLELDISPALDAVGSISDAFDEASSNFADSLAAAMDSALSAVGDIAGALDDAGSGFGDSLGGAAGGADAASSSLGNLSSSLDQVGISALGNAAGMDISNTAAKGLGATSEVLQGKVGGLIRTMAPQVAIFAGVTAAITGLIVMGDKVILSQERLKDVFGSSGAGVLSTQILDLGRSLSELNAQTGVSDTKMRMVLSTFGQIAVGSGATQEGAAKVAREMGGLAGIITTLNPSLGTTDSIFQMLTRGLGGSVRILQRYGITIDAATQAQMALANAHAAGRDKASLYDKQVAGLALSMQFFNDQSVAAGTTLQERLNVAVDSSTNQFKRLKGEISTTLENIAVPLVKAGLEIANAMTPIVTSIIDIFGEITSVVLDVIAPISIVIGSISTAVIGLIGVFLTVRTTKLIWDMVAGGWKDIAAAVRFAIRAYWTLTLDVIPAVITALASLTAAEAIATAGLSLLAGVAAVAIFSIFTSTDEAAKKAADSAKKWAASFIQGARDSGDELKTLTDEHKALTNSVKLLTKAQDDLQKKRMEIGTPHDQSGAEMFVQAIKIAESLRTQQTRLDAIQHEYKKLREEQKATDATTAQLSNTFGVVLPPAIAMSKKELEAFTKASQVVGSVFGGEALKMLMGAQATTEGLTNLTKVADSFAQTLEGSMESVTNVFSHTFTDKIPEATVISEGAMEDFFVSSRQGAQKWAVDIGSLINKGVDIGIIQQMAKAGPGSQPSLDAFVAMVNEHGVQWVNDWQHSGDAAAHATEAAFNQMAVKAAVTSAEIAAVGKAAFDDMQHGGHASLEALTASMDTNMAQMAKDALKQLGIIQLGVEGLHGKEVFINVNSGNTVAEVQALINSLAFTVPAGTYRGTPSGPQPETGDGRTNHYDDQGQFAGFYGLGGVVPGAIGQAQLAVVHGGENVQTVAQQRDLSDAIKMLTRELAQEHPKQQPSTQELHFHGVASATDAVDEFEWHMKTAGF